MMNIGGGGMPDGSDLSWGLFALTGSPAYYLLYKNILDSDNILSEDGLTEEQRQRR